MAFGLRKAKAEPAGEVRRGDRHDMRIPANAIIGANEAIDVLVENLSTSGFKAMIPADLAIGAVFRIGLMPGRARHARIVWRQDDAYGCEFLAPIDSADIVG